MTFAKLFLTFHKFLNFKPNFVNFRKVSPDKNENILLNGKKALLLSRAFNICFSKKLSKRVLLLILVLDFIFGQNYVVIAGNHY